MLIRKYRLLKGKEFQAVFQKGRFFAEDFIILRVMKNNLEISRFGFVVGLKISKKATLRHQVKRRIREIIRSNINKIKPGLDIVVLPKAEIKGKTYQEISRTLIIAMEKAGVFIS